MKQEYRCGSLLLTTLLLWSSGTHAADTSQTGCKIYHAIHTGMTIPMVKQTIRANYNAHEYAKHPFRTTAYYQWTLSNDMVIQVEFDVFGRAIHAALMSTDHLKPNESAFVQLLKNRQLTLVKARALLGAGELLSNNFYYTFPDQVNLWGRADSQGKLNYLAINAGCNGGVTSYKKL